MTSQLIPTEVPPGADRTLASLAFINVTWETSRTSYLDNFVPFALEALRSQPNPMLPAEARDLIHTRFGIQFPVGVVAAMFDRAVRTGKVRRVGGTERLALSRGTANRLPDLSLQQGACRREQGFLVKALVHFAESRFEVCWEESSAEEALLAFVEQNVMSLLDTSVRGSSWQVESGTAEDRSFVVSTFISEILNSDPESFGYLDNLIKGSMLASVLYIEPSGQVLRKFKRTVLLIDTPVALRMLGYEGREAQEAAASILHLATQQGAKFGCFMHSVKEMRGVLHAALGTVGRSPGGLSGPGGVARYFRESKSTRSDIEFAIANLERDLAQLGVQIFDVPDYVEYLGVDEDSLEATLQEEVHYRESATRLADLRSLTAIHRWRRGQSDCHLETCRAVLVTNNKRLVRASRRFFNDGHHQWPLCISDSSLAALLWVKAPRAVPDLPRRQMVADCYSAMAPSQALWSKFLAEVSRLESRGRVEPEGVALLRYSHEAQQAVMDVTFGNPARVTEESVEATLAKAREAASAQAIRERDDALARVEAAESAEASSRFDATRQAAEAEALQTRVESLEQRERQRVDLLKARYARTVDRAIAVVKALAIILLFASAIVVVATYVPALSAWFVAPIEGLLRGAGGLVALVSILALWRGDSVSGLLERLRNWMLARRLRREGLSDSFPCDE